MENINKIVKEFFTKNRDLTSEFLTKNKELTLEFSNKIIKELLNNGIIVNNGIIPEIDCEMTDVDLNIDKFTDFFEPSNRSEINRSEVNSMFTTYYLKEFGKRPGNKMISNLKLAFKKKNIIINGRKKYSCKIRSQFLDVMKELNKR